MTEGITVRLWLQLKRWMSRSTFKQTTNARSQIDSTLILIVIGLPPAVRFFMDVVILDLRGLTVTSPLCFCIKLTISFSWIPEPLPPVVFTMVAGCLPGVGCCTITTLPEIRDKTIIEEYVTEYRQITMKFISLLTCSLVAKIKSSWKAKMWNQTFAKMTFSLPYKIR